MPSRNVPPAVRAAIYFRLLNGEPAEAIANEYNVSPPTVIRYATDAALEIRLALPPSSDRSVRAFLYRTLKYQIAQSNPAIIGALIEASQASLGDAKEPLFTKREAADCPMSFRVTRTTSGKFNAIVERLNQTRPERVSVSELLREIIEAYTENATIPVSEAQILQTNQLADDIARVLKQHGYSL